MRSTRHGVLLAEIRDDARPLPDELGDVIAEFKESFVASVTVDRQRPPIPPPPTRRRARRGRQRQDAGDGVS